MIVAVFASLFLAAMTSADAVVTVLNSASATGPRTFAEAKQIVERDAKDGKPLQQFVYGLLIADGARAQHYRDVSRARIRQMADERDNPLAWYLLSAEDNDLKKLKRAAEGGNVQALNALGTVATQEALNARFLTTNELERVLKRSFDYFAKAAAQRDANGFINLGACYLRGFGCEKDKALAFECFKSAAEAGHPEGMDNMSACYQFGHGVRKDDELSLYWRMRGRAARGDESAEKWLKSLK